MKKFLILLLVLGAFSPVALQARGPCFSFFIETWCPILMPPPVIVEPVIIEPYPCEVIEMVPMCPVCPPPFCEGCGHPMYR